MEVISKRHTTNLSCSFCEKDITEVRYLFKQGLGTMCPDCVTVIKDVMDESIKNQELEGNGPELA